MLMKLSPNVAKVLLAFLFSVVAVIIYIIVNKQLQSAVQISSEAGNAVLTHVFVNEAWPEIAPLLPKPGASEQEIRENKNIKQIDSKVRKFASYTDIVKVKLYNIKGLTIYSSDPKQIGEDKSKNLGFLQATRGNLASELTFRGQFGSFDGEIYKRNLVSTYAPIKDGYQVIAVAEIYSDRTNSIEISSRHLNQFIGGLSIVLLVLYLLILSLIKGFIVTSKSAQNLSVESNDAMSGSNSIVDCESRLTLLEFYFGKSSKLAHFVGLISYLIHKDKLSFRTAFPKLENISHHAASNFSNYKIANQILSKTYTVRAEKFNEEVFIENLLFYIKAYTNIDSKLITTYNSGSSKSIFYQDTRLINGLIYLLIDILSICKYNDRIDLKLVNTQEFIELTIIFDIKSGATPPYILGKLEFYKKILGDLTEDQGIKGEMHTSDKSTVANLRFYPLNPISELKFNSPKCLICLRSEDELLMVSSILEESAIEFDKCDPSENLIHLVRKNLFNTLIIDSNVLHENWAIQEQLDIMINEGLLLSSRILVINYEAEFTYNSRFATLEIPFSAADLLRQLG